MKKAPLGFWSVFSIGVGGMVGGGIFAVLGLTIELAHGGAPIAFLISGLVALLSSYSYAHLSVTYPSQGGTVRFLNEAFGIGIFSTSLNILLCLSYVIMLSLYSYAFGSYGASFFDEHWQNGMKHLFISFIIIFITILNILGAKVVGRTEIWFVMLKIAILVIFIAIGLFFSNFKELNPIYWSSTLKLISGGMIIFLAYEGFELIANTAHDISNPRQILPYTYYSAVIFVIVLYVTISIVTLGTLKLSQILAAISLKCKTFSGKYRLHSHCYSRSFSNGVSY